MDLSTLDTSLKANTGVDFNLRHPASNVKLPLIVSVLGADSDKLRKVMDATTDAIFKEIAQTGKVGARSAESTREDRIRAVAECIIGWQGVVKDGVALECTMENKISILSHPGYGWLLDQIELFIKDRANFLPE